jgi:NADH:ubiquinone oxidoreductase subunit K
MAFNVLGVYLFVAFALFVFGSYTILTRKHLVAVLMGLELILNAANINFVAFARFKTFSFIEGHIFAFLIIFLAAAEAALALGIILNIYRNTSQVLSDRFTELKG